MIERKFDPAEAIEHLYSLVKGLTERLSGPMVYLESGSDVVRPGVGGVVDAEYTIRINRAWDTPVNVTYTTTDTGTAQGSSGKLTIIAYDEKNDNIPFIVTHDDPEGGRMVFDGGFPKFMNSRITEIPCAQTIYANNLITWIGRGDERNVLLLTTGDSTVSYGSSDSHSSGFGGQFPTALRASGHSVTVRHYAELKAGAPAVTTSMLAGYDAVILIDSGNNYTISAASAQAFADYVNAGGGIFLIYDHAPQFITSASQVAIKFEVELYGFIDRSPSVELDTIIAQGSNSELLAGLAGLSWGADTSEGGIRILGPVQEYIPTTGLVEFAPGETEKTIKIRVIGNDTYTDSRTIDVQVYSQWLTFQATAQITILPRPV